MKLHEWLDQRSISPDKFSKDMGISKSYVYMLLSGRKIPGTRLTRDIIEYTKGEISSKDLMEGRSICAHCNQPVYFKKASDPNDLR